jgi:hypothetical protein
VGAACAALLAVGVARAEPAAGPAPAPSTRPEPDQLEVAEAFAGSYVLLEHSASVGHFGDLSPAATFAFVQTWLFYGSLDATDWLNLAVDFGLQNELTPNPTTYAREALAADLGFSATATMPLPPEVADVLGWQLGLRASFPTSKASTSASLVLGLEPGLSFSATAPLLDGLTFTTYASAIPYIHRYTTYSTLTPRPCSRAAGCDLGATTETGWRNTKVQARFGGSVGLWALRHHLSVGLSFEALYGWLYDLSPAPGYDDAALTNPGNGDGSPATLTTQFVASVGVQPHPAVGLTIGLWTPGGIKPDGGYYNPFGNRFSSLYLDVTFTPLAGVVHEVRAAREREAAR